MACTFRNLVIPICDQVCKNRAYLDTNFGLTFELYHNFQSIQGMLLKI